MSPGHTWDISIDIPQEGGESIKGRLRSDDTIWVGDTQVGSLDRNTGDVIPKELSFWDKAGQGLLQAGLTGLNVLFKPFQLYEEYVAKPFAVAATRFGWQKDWWNSLSPEEQQKEKQQGDISNMPFTDIGRTFKGLMPGGEFREAYESWESPKYLKGSIEMLPWFLIPAVGHVSRGVGLAGKGMAGFVEQAGFRVGGKILEYSPFGLMEKGIGKVIEVPIKAGSKVLGKVSSLKEFKLNGFPSVNEQVDTIRAIRGKTLKPLGAGATEKQIINREKEHLLNDIEPFLTGDHALGSSEAARAASYINPRNLDEIMGFKEVAVPLEGTKFFNKQILITAPWIKAKAKNAPGLVKASDGSILGIAPNDFLRNPSSYKVEGLLRQGQVNTWRNNVSKIYSDTERFATENIKGYAGIPKRETEQYAHSVVMGKVDRATGKEFIERPYPAGAKGGTPGMLKDVKFKTDAEGIMAGFKYADPVASVHINTKEMYNNATFQRVEGILKYLWEDPNQTMSREVKEQMAALVKRVKVLGGGVVSTNWEGKTVTRVFPGVEGLINRMLRGEVPSGQTIRAIEMVEPEIGRRLRGALDIPVMEVDEAISRVSKDIWNNIKVTPARFRSTLKEVRGDIAAKQGEKVTPVTPEVTKPPISPSVKKPVISEIPTPPEGVVPPPAATRAISEPFAVTGKGNVTPGELTATLNALGVEQNQSIKFVKKLMQEAYKNPKAERRALLRVIAQDAQAEAAVAKVMRTAYIPTYKAARQAAMDKAFQEGRILDVPRWRNKIIPDKTEWGEFGADIAKRLNKILTPEKQNAALVKAHEITRASVALTAALDFSLLFIQGPLVLGHDLAQWASGKKSTAFFNMAKEMAKGLYNPKFQDEFIAKNVTAEMGQHFLETRKVVDYMQTADLQRWVSKIPKVGGVLSNVFKESYGRFSTSFGSGSLAARVTIFNEARDAWVKGGFELSELAQMANKITGVIDPRILGISPMKQMIASATLFSPNYTRAYLMVIQDLFKGTKTAAEVRKAMAGMLAGGVLGYVGLSEMLGQEPKLNPAPKSLGGDGAEFMSFKFKNSIVGLPGFWYSAIRMMAGVTAAAESEPERLLSLDWRQNDFLKFWMGRTSPLVHLGEEIRTQRDFLGRRLEDPGDWLDVIGQKFVTIAAQNLITRDASEEEGKYHRVGAEIFGLRTYPQSRWMKLKDMQNEYAQKDFSKPFEQLNREQKATLEQTYPDYNELKLEADQKMVLDTGEDWERRLWGAKAQADAEYNKAGETLAMALQNGQIDYRTFLNQESSYREVYFGQKQMARYIEELADPEARADLKKWKEKHPLPPEDAALDKYWEIRRNWKVDAQTGIPDWDTMEKKTQAFLDGLDSETRAYVLKMKDTGLDKLPPVLQKIRRIQSQGREKIDQYYEQDMGRARMAYRRQYPEVDAWLILMGRVSRPVSSIGLNRFMQLAQQYGLPMTMFPKLGQQTQQGRTGGGLSSLM